MQRGATSQRPRTDGSPASMGPSGGPPSTIYYALPGAQERIVDLMWPQRGGGSVYDGFIPAVPLCIGFDKGPPIHVDVPTVCRRLASERPHHTMVTGDEVSDSKHGAPINNGGSDDTRYECHIIPAANVYIILSRVPRGSAFVRDLDVGGFHMRVYFSLPGDFIAPPAHIRARIAQSMHADSSDKEVEHTKGILYV